jgi:DNA-binding MarR family transcriptional regulator
MSTYPNIEACNPIQCIASKLMQGNRLINNLFRKHIAPHDLSNSQCNLLLVLSQKKEITQVELGHFLFLEKSSIKRNTDRLIDLGYFDAKSRPKIKITPKGLAKIESVIPSWDKAMAEAKALLGDDGIEALNLVISKLTNL